MSCVRDCLGNPSKLGMEVFKRVAKRETPRPGQEWPLSVDVAPTGMVVASVFKRDPGHLAVPDPAWRCGLVNSGEGFGGGEWALFLCRTFVAPECGVSVLRASVEFLQISSSCRPLRAFWATCTAPGPCLWDPWCLKQRPSLFLFFSFSFFFLSVSSLFPPFFLSFSSLFPLFVLSLFSLFPLSLFPLSLFPLPLSSLPLSSLLLSSLSLPLSSPSFLSLFPPSFFALCPLSLSSLSFLSLFLSFLSSSALFGSLWLSSTAPASVQSSCNSQRVGALSPQPRSVKDGARGTEERALMSSENKSAKDISKPMSISTRPSMQRCRRLPYAYTRIARNVRRWCPIPPASTGESKVAEDARAACAGDTKIAEKDWVVKSYSCECDPRFHETDIDGDQMRPRTGC